MELVNDISTRENAGKVSLMAEAMNEASATRNDQFDKSDDRVHQEAFVHQELDSWNPMADDYSNLAFNDYREPTIEELRQWMPKPGNSGPSEDLMACYRSRDGDVRLFISGIPNDMTQEGIKGLFSQVGKVVYCKVIPQRDSSRTDKFGFVGYHSYREAEHAIRKFDGFILGLNMKLRVALAKEKPKLPKIKPSIDEHLSYSNSLEEKLENNELDWGPPATPLNLTASMGSDSSLNHLQDYEKPVDINSSGCNGEIQNAITGQEAFKKPIAAVIEPMPCSKCGKKGCRRCGNCKIPYCSRECQRSHWSEHKKVCKWKTSDEKSGKSSLHSTPDGNSPLEKPSNPSQTIPEDVDTSKEREQQSSPRQESSPSQDPCTVDDEDLEFSELRKFANFMGIHLVPKSPSESPSPPNLIGTKSRSPGNPLCSPQESHYGYLKPLKRASPKPLITEISSSPEPVADEESSKRSTPNKDQLSMSVDAPSSVSDVQGEEQSVMAPGNDETGEEPPKVPYKRYFIVEVPHEKMSLGGSYEIVATFVSSPTLFWAQLYEASSLANQNYLFETIRREYENTEYKTYVPSTNELCIAQFSNDNNWYRSKVDYIGNNGLVRVSHIDFGSSEDVDPSKIRRIKEELVYVPRQAIKCALYLPECSDSSKEWSSDAIENLRSKILDVKSRVVVKEVKGSLVYLDVYDCVNNTKINDIYKEMQLEKTVLHRPIPVYPNSSQSISENRANEEEISLPNTKNLRDLSREPPSETLGRAGSPSSSCSSSFTSTSISADSQISSQEHEVSPLVNEDTGLPPLETPLTAAIDNSFKNINLSAPENEGVNTEMQTSSKSAYGGPRNPNIGNPDHKANAINTDRQASGEAPPCPAQDESLSSRSSSKSSSEIEFQLNQPELSMQNTGIVHGLPFKAVVTSVKSPWEFTVKLSDPNFAVQLESVTKDLNIYCSNAEFEAEKVFSYGELCAVKLTEDQTWHRGKVMANFQQEGYKIKLIDLGSDRIVAAQNIRSMPERFKDLEPQCRLFSLGGVRRPAGSLVWGKDACEKFSSLVLFRSFSFKEITRFKQSHIVELLDETGQPSVAAELINAGLADAYIKKVQRIQDFKEPSKFKLAKAFIAPLKSAIAAANLPPQNSTFQLMATEVESPGQFFIQLVDTEVNQRLSELCAEMNKYYADSMPHPEWQPRETEVCAAFFKGSWFRTYVNSLDGDNAANIYCVDFGNSEVVSTSVLRPLAPTFQMLPYCALRCSLGNICPPKGQEWPKEATDFIKMKIPIYSTLTAHLFYKAQSILFVDVFVSFDKTMESITKLLVAKGMACFQAKKEAIPPSATPGMSKDRFECKISPQKPQISAYSLSVYGCAIAAAKLPNEKETFEGVVTEVMPSGEFFIHVADEALALQLIELTNDMNRYYSTAIPTRFEAKQNLLCAANFSSDWRRAYILEVNSDETAKVYDVDFGKTDVLPVSRLQFLQPQFTTLQYFALRCKMSTPRGISWSKESYELFLSKVKLLSPVTFKLSTKKRGIMFVDVLIPDNEQSLSEIIISQSQERKCITETGGYRRQMLPNSPEISQASRERSIHSDKRSRGTSDTKAFNFEKALNSVHLPPEGQSLNVVITEFVNPQCFFVHSDVEMAKKLASMSTDMNNHYNSVPRSTFHPVENQLCVAPFGSPNDWYRALIENIYESQIARVFFVDYGNTDEVPLADLRPLEDRFSSLPYCALHTSLANIKPISEGWTANVIDFVKSKLPVNEALSLKLVSRQQDTLDVDLADPSFGEGSLCSDLVKNGLASYSSLNGKKSPPRSNVSLSPKKPILTPLESAIASAALPRPLKDTFQVIATHITSPGSFAVQIADYEMACRVAALGKEMNLHYNPAKYPSFQPTTYQLCAAQFTGNNEWYRGWIDGIECNDSVRVYYPDYGNSEVLDISRLRPLEKRFIELQFLALRCSIANVVPSDQREWQQEAIDLFISKVPLYEPINVKLFHKKKDCLFLDILDPNESSATLSKAFVDQGLAVWMQATKRTKETNQSFQSNPKQGERKRAKLVTNDTSAQSRGAPLAEHCLSSPPRNQAQEDKGQIPCSQIPMNKHLLESLPMVSVPKGEFFNAMVCDIKKTGAVSLQVLMKELKDLDPLCMKIGQHCSQLDHSPYCPVVGELCLACFTQDKNWYRAVVTDILPNNHYKVTFVDFGNDDTLSPSDIRKVQAEFLHLPRQAYTGFLAGLPGSKTGDLLGEEIMKALGEKLLDKRVFARVNESANEIEFFSVGDDEKPDTNINQEFLQKIAENTARNKQSIPTSLENEFMALVSEVIGVGEIWVQKKDSLVSLNNLKEDLSSFCDTGNAVHLTTLPRPGDVCLSKFSIDRKWYRAKVIESNSPDNILVLFLDYGNTEITSLENLRQAKPEFLQFPFQGIKCYLFGVAQGNPDGDDYIQQILNRELEVKVRERHSEELGVELQDYGVPNGPFNLNEHLIAFGYSA